jgi:hypothetical protein
VVELVTQAAARTAAPQRRRAANPRPAKPSSIIAQVEGSATAA